jgi:pimeloyl-ACP methyl ester carboxylesterase
MTTATLHDGNELGVEIQGEGPFLLLPVNPTPAEGEAAEEMRKWGADPALGRSLIDGLRDMVTVVAFDYEGHLMASPKPDTLTPSNISSDVLAVADAAGAGTFAYYGYSWLAVTGMQLATRTDRLTALIMGGFPPLDAPYAEMLEVTNATHRMASEPGPVYPLTDGPSEPGDWSTVEFDMAEPQARQFLTLYTRLQDFDERRALSQLDCPRMCFAGSEDEIVYDERWGCTHVSIARPFEDHRRELEANGWSVRLLDGLDHTQAMQPDNVLPVIRPWLAAELVRPG